MSFSISLLDSAVNLPKFGNGLFTIYFIEPLVKERHVYCFSNQLPKEMIVKRNLSILKLMFYVGPGYLKKKILT